MHIAAWLTGSLFFTHLDFYLPRNDSKHLQVLEVGSHDFDGNMRDAISFSTFSSRNYTYTGVDMFAGPNVDLVLDYSRDWTGVPQPVDLILSVSTFERDVFFWQTFLKMSEALKEGGFLLLILPQKRPLDQQPGDWWRFMPDSAQALASWARYNGIYMHIVFNELIRSAGKFEDIVTVFYRGVPPYSEEEAAAWGVRFKDLAADVAVNLEALLQYLPQGMQQVSVTSNGELVDTNHAKNDLYRLRSSIDAPVARDVVCRRLATYNKRHLHLLNREQLIIPVENSQKPHIPLKVTIPTGNCFIDFIYLLTMEELLFEGKLRVNTAAAYERLGLENSMMLVSTIQQHREEYIAHLIHMISS